MNRIELHRCLEKLGACPGALAWVNSFPPDTPAEKIAMTRHDQQGRWFLWLSRELNFPGGEYIRRVNDISIGLPDAEYAIEYDQVYIDWGLALLIALQNFFIGEY